MQHAYASFNKTVEALVAEVASDLPVIFDHPTGEDGQDIDLPPNCVRVYWLSEGEASDVVNQEESTVQIDIFLGDGDRARAREIASTFNDRFGLRSGAGFGILGRFDHNQDPPAYLSEMRLEPFESGWLQVPDPSPRQVHMARTFFLSYTV